MSRTFSRRALLTAAAAMPLAGAQVFRRPEGSANTPPASQPGPLRRAVLSSMLPPADSWKARFALAAAAGFDGVEMVAVESPDEAEEIARAAAATKLSIQSVTCPSIAQFPLSSADPDVAKKGVAALKTALTVAAMWHAEEVVVTPAVVNESTPPSAAWRRSQAILSEQILPLAGGFKLHVGLAVPTEKFLLSAIDCNRFIDELKSPWARASLSVGDALGAGGIGVPQEWIRSLGRRLSGLRLSDRHIDRKAGTSERRNIGDGDVNWQDVRKAMSDAPFVTWVTADVAPGPGAYLSNVRVRVDKFLAGFRPAS